MFAVDAAATAEAALVNGGDVVTVFVTNADGDLRNLASAVGAAADGRAGGGGDEAERKIKVILYNFFASFFCSNQMKTHTSLWWLNFNPHFLFHFS